MAGFHAAFDPGVLSSVSDGVKLLFTSPPDASDVKIEIVEVDTWRVDGLEVTEGTGSDDKRAEIFGDIVGGKFVFKSITTFLTITLGTPTTFMNLPVEIEGQQHQVPLQNLRDDKEFGFFEIVFRVSGTIAGAAAKYASPAPLFCRNIPSPRAEIAFLVGTPNDLAEAFTKPYFPNAEKIWSKVVDNANSRKRATTLRAVLDFITSAANLPRRMQLPWGQVNVITHGNGVQWILRVEATDPIVRKMTAGDLAAVTNLPVPGASDLDGQSLVIVRGCEVGQDPNIVAQIFRLFGSKATVLACKCVVKYRGKIESLLDEFRFSLKGAGNPSVAVIKSTLKANFGQKPDYAAFTDDDWQRIASATSTNTDDLLHREVELIALPFKSQFNEDTVLNAAGNDKSQAELEAIAKSSWTGVTPFDDLAWDPWVLKKVKNRVPQGNGTFILARFELSSTGKKTNFSYRQVLTRPGTTDPVRPDLNNPRHFARFP